MFTKVLFFRDIIAIILYKTYEKKKLNIKSFKVFGYKVIKIYFKDLY